MPDLFASKLEPIDMPDADVRYAPSVELGTSPRALFEELREGTAWRQEEVLVWGKRHLQPRLVAWFGDPGRAYSYSGISLKPEPWTQRLLEIRAIIQDLCGAEFNSVLLNYYRDHRDSMGMHSDDEPELGSRPIIASLSLGERRTLVFKSKRHDPPLTRRFLLPSGSLLMMAGETQLNWKHGIAKESRPCGARINLTFRQIKVQ
ncbi:alpha-ketoglutarate-dependent dioxygenase AlkB [Phenylobacterium sp.]|uniref:alpha-ketoglutarate-dependent dioxygenase AlkB family protein n=1 Tax=Phenylobacterium sp. TaxID=1871053 RepID=UPI00281126F9|nr:alpha-ketoglutarate-dependent dioxygenase AlkB [Phenylobacterium sp.]